MKSEIRNPKSETNSKSEFQMSQTQAAPRFEHFRLLNFGFVSDFGVQISDFS